MKRCECGAEIDDKYFYCLDCAQKKKEEKKSGDGDVVKALGALNNNLYAIRTQLDVVLAENHGKRVEWSKIKKDFIVIPYED